MRANANVVEPMPCRMVPSRPASTAYDRMATITVPGNAKTKYRVFYAYRGVLSHYSLAFRKLLEVQGACGDSLLLDGISPDTFSMFFDWTNTGVFHIPDIVSDDSWNVFIDAYDFAKRYGAHDFGNRILEAFHFTLRNEPSISVNAMTIVYNRTDDTSELRKLLAIWAFKFHEISHWPTDLEGGAKIPGDLVWDIVNLSYLRQQAVGFLEGASRVESEKNTQDTKDTFCHMYHTHDGH